MAAGLLRSLRPPHPRYVVIATVACAVDLVVWGFYPESRLGGDAPVPLVVAVAAVAYATLAVRQRPLLGYAALWVFGLVGLVLPRFESIAGLSVALYATGRRASPTPARMALAGALVPAAINAVNGGSWRTGSLDPTATVVQFALWSALFAAAWLTGTALSRGDRQRLEADRLRAEAIRTEKLEISRELHDSVAHALTAIVLQAAGAARGHQVGTVDGPQLADALSSIEKTGAQSMRELHRLLGLLRQAGTDAAASDPQHTLAEVAHLVDTARAAGLDLRRDDRGRPSALDPSVEHTGYRIAQEGLSNAMKYAPAGAPVTLDLAWSPGRLDVTVTNPTTGRPRPGTAIGGFGLVGLRERVHAVGGTLAVTHDEGRFVLSATLPTEEP